MIGIFDSGSGGLTVFKEIKKSLPHADFVYFGDLKNVPYGNKTPEEIGILTYLGFKKLIENGATKIVSACNSASANIVLPYLKELNLKPQNIIEMVHPTTNYFKDKKDKKILLVATEATINSGIYQEGFKNIGMEIQTLPMPDLARAIEEGTSSPAILAMIGSALEKYNGTYDTLVLSCTHFPLVTDFFKRNVPSGVEVFDPAEAVANEVVRLFPYSRELENSLEGGGKIKFIISKDSQFFREKVSEIFPNGEYTIDVLI